MFVALGLPGLIVVVGLVVVVRPLSVWIATMGLKLSTRERAFIAAVAPRGIVAAAVASITAANLESQGIDGGPSLKALVFLVIGVTVIVSGLTARPLAGLLSVRLPRRDRVAILGARGLALPLAEQLRTADVPVVFLEYDPKRSRVAEEAGFPVVFGDPLEERTFLRARPELVGKAVGATSNEHFNSLFVRQALETFDVPDGLITMESLFGEQNRSLLPEENADVLFDGSHDHERWDVRWRHDEVVVELFDYVPPQEESDETAHAPATARSKELFAIVSVARGRLVLPMHVGYQFRKGDVAAIAMHAPDREEALTALQRQGWSPSTSAPIVPPSTRQPTEAARRTRPS